MYMLDTNAVIMGEAHADKRQGHNDSGTCPFSGLHSGNEQHEGVFQSRGTDDRGLEIARRLITEIQRNTSPS